MAVFYKPRKSLDLNRYRKVYRYIRKKPKNQAEDNISVFNWACYFVDFDNQASVTHEFPCCFDSAPVVVATSDADVNVFVSSVSSSSATIETSAAFTGRVYYQALIGGAYNMPNIGRDLEAFTLSYSSTSTQTYTFTSAFSCPPIITATASQDVNVFVTAVSTSQVTIEVSDASYSGDVYVQAIEKGC
jgi:hypothetical protein